MKKLLPLFLFLCYQLVSAQTPITYAITDVPAANSILRIAVDTVPLPSVNFGSKGANQFYDFSNLTLFKYDTVEFKTPTSNQLSTCPQADVAITTDGVNFVFTNTDANTNKLILEGFQGLACPGQSITAAYSTKPDLYHFPTTYSSNFSGSGYLQKTVSGSQVCQGAVSQVRLTTTTTYTDTIDGWGIVKTPVGTYKCLRKQRKETTRNQIEAYYLFSWNDVSDETKTTIRYSYLTKEAKGSIVNFNYDTANVLQSVSWATVLPVAPVADFTFVNGSGGTVNFTDASDNATSWAWTFGDGGTSTQEDPSHTYAANGTYTVCLISTNAGGSSTQVCKQVTVNNIAVAPVAAFAWVNTTGGTVNFTDQSTNTPTQWAWTFGDAGTSTQQNPTHVYTANGTYNVCLTATNGGGSNQHCENVIVNGLVAGNNAPVAVDDTVSLTQATSITIFHVATNDVDPDGDNICLTAVWGSPYVTEYIGGSCDMVSITPDSNFVGTDTAWYRLCDNGSPVLCDTALIIFTVTANPALYPTAVNDVATALQPDGALVNVTANDITPNGSVCVTDIYGGDGAFIISGCDNIDYTPDSLFTGNDTVWYVICDNGHPTWCDTAMLVVTSNANPALLPVAGFGVDQTHPCEKIGAFNSTANSDTVEWLFNMTGLNDSVYLTGDTVYYNITVTNGFGGTICQFVSNQFGRDTFCRTLNVICEGINEISLTDIQLYPNPAQNNITVDMSRNDDEATRNYAGIEIFNAIGEKVKVVTGTGNKLVTISVTDLTEGIYMASLLDAKGTRRTLGRFTIAR